MPKILIDKPDYLEIDFDDLDASYLRYNNIDVKVEGMPYYGKLWYEMIGGNWIKLSQNYSDLLEDKYQQCLKPL